MVGGVGLGGLGFKRWWWGSERAKANRGSHSEGRGGGQAGRGVGHSGGGGEREG